MGRLSMRRCSMVSVEELRWVSTKLASELTFTTSFAPAIERTIGKLAICPTVMATSLISILAKPGLSTVTVYAPGGSARMRYSPSLFTVVERSKPLACSCAVTVALVTTLPFGSLTVTCRSPLATPWAKLNVVSSSSRKVSETSFRTVISLSIELTRELPRAGGIEQPRLAGFAKARTFRQVNPGRFVQQEIGGNQARLLRGIGLVIFSELRAVPSPAAVNRDHPSFNRPSTLALDSGSFLLHRLQAPGHARCAVRDSEAATGVEQNHPTVPVHAIFQ